MPHIIKDQLPRFSVPFCASSSSSTCLLANSHVFVQSESNSFPNIFISFPFLWNSCHNISLPYLPACRHHLYTLSGTRLLITINRHLTIVSSCQIKLINDAIYRNVSGGCTNLFYSRFYSVSAFTCPSPDTRCMTLGMLATLCGLKGYRRPDIYKHKRRCTEAFWTFLAAAGELPVHGWSSM